MIVAWVIGAVFAVTIVFIFSSPDSFVAGILDRFQTLFTGIFAGLAALVAAGLVYRAAKLPIDAEREKAAQRKRAMKTAGASRLLSAVHGINMALAAEAGTPTEKRLGRVIMPNMLPSLEVISTQDSGVILELSKFLTSATKFDTHTALATWQYDPNKTDPAEEKAFDDLMASGKKLQAALVAILQGE